MRFRDYSGTEQFRPLSAWAYLGYAILFAIPIVGWFFLLIFAFSTKNYNRRSYARSYWCGLFIAAIIFGSWLTIGDGADGLDEKVSALEEWIQDTPERLEKKVSAFEERIQETPERISVTVSPTARPTQNVSNAATGEKQVPSATSTKQASISLINGVTPDFKKTMDEYEAFFDSYIEFMENFDADSATITQLLKYTEMMTHYAEAMEALDQIDESTLTEADDWYYVEVTSRINQKIVSFEAKQ